MYNIFNYYKQTAHFKSKTNVKHKIQNIKSLQYPSSIANFSSAQHLFRTPTHHHFKFRPLLTYVTVPHTLHIQIHNHTFSYGRKRMFACALLTLMDEKVPKTKKLQVKLHYRYYSGETPNKKLTTAIGLL